MANEDCIFCKIVKGEIPAVKIFEDEKHFAFLDMNPISFFVSVRSPASGGSAWMRIAVMTPHPNNIASRRGLDFLMRS